MARTRTLGRVDRDGRHIIDKNHRGVAIYLRLGRISQEHAEQTLKIATGLMRALLSRLQTQLAQLEQQLAALEREIVLWHRQNDDSRRLARISGIGPLTASAYVASLGNAKGFKNGRQVAAWLGIVPRQDSSGGKPKLLGISKHGDVYLRTLLIHGARAVLRHVEHRPDQADSWLRRLMVRCGKNVAALPLANKNARIAWALLAHQREFEPHYVSTAANR